MCVVLLGLGLAGLSFVSSSFYQKTDHKPFVGEFDSNLYYHLDRGLDLALGQLKTRQMGQSSLLGMLGPEANTPCSVADLIDSRFPG